MPADARDVEYVELAGEVGRIIRQTVVKTFKTSEFTELMQRAGGINTGLMPFNCIFFKEGRYERNGVSGVSGMHYRLHVIAIKPRVATIRFQGVDQEEAPEVKETKLVRTFAVAMPWIFYFVLYQNNGLARVVMAASTEPDGIASKGLGLQMSVVPLPNINSSGNFCLGELRLDSAQPFYEKTNRIVQFIDESVWNNDLWPKFGHPDYPERLPNIHGLRHWAAKTEEHGQGFWRNLRLLPLHYTAENLILELTK